MRDESQLADGGRGEVVGSAIWSGEFSVGYFPADHPSRISHEERLPVQAESRCCRKQRGDGYDRTICGDDTTLNVARSEDTA